MKKKTCLLGMAVLLAALLALPGVGQSAMWVGAELGGTFQPNTNFTVNGVNSGAGQVMPSVIGGMTLGYDFVNAGFGAYAWPDWMKYFSVATDVTYNRLMVQDGGPGIGAILPPNARMNGYEVAWTFLFMAHYGFLPDNEVPSGRINPYIGVGPAIVWSGADFALPVNSVTKNTNSRFNGSSTNVALVVEPGIRWVALKNVSIDTALRWRYSEPSWNADGVTIKADPLSQWAVLIRANYHF
ncbi:MAG: hypothetical protein WBV23_11290 [Desulfobaccales bacterium]